MSLRPFQFNTDSDGHMLSQSVDTSLNLYQDVPTDPIARQLFHEELTPTATTLPIPATCLNNHPLDNKARCRTCETIIGEHHVVTANSHNGDGSPVSGRVIQFHKGALFNVTHHSLLPALVFGAQVQSTEALNVTAIVSATVRATVAANELDVRGTVSTDASHHAVSVLPAPRPS
jgi:hypothetical protein